MNSRLGVQEFWSSLARSFSVTHIAKFLLFSAFSCVPQKSSRARRSTNCSLNAVGRFRPAARLISRLLVESQFANAGDLPSFRARGTSARQARLPLPAFAW